MCRPCYAMWSVVAFPLLVISVCSISVGAPIVDVPPEEQEVVTIPPQDRNKFTPIDPEELAKRYPAGKKWKSQTISRVEGTGSSSSWGLQGEVHFAIANRYATKVEILDNQVFGSTRSIRMRVEILDAGGTKVVSRQKLRWVGLDASDPIMQFVLGRLTELSQVVSPEVRVLIRVLEDWEKLDPQFEKTLTEVARRLGLPIETVKPIEMEWVRAEFVRRLCVRG